MDHNTDGSLFCVRVSKHFILSDFLHSPGVWTAQLPVAPLNITAEQLDAGRHLCVDILRHQAEKCAEAGSCLATGQQHLMP